MVTGGKTETGRPICKPLKPESFFETYNDAYLALVEYNKNPYDLAPSITMEELYEKWTESYFTTLKSEASQRAITSAWSYCSEIYKMRVKDVRARHVKGCMEDSYIEKNGERKYPTANVKAKIKSMFNIMLDYAVEYELVDKNYARTFNVSTDIEQEQKESRKGHISFTDEEMNILWENVDKVDFVDVILIQCYSGWRPQEVGLIELENIDLENWIFTGGMKTAAGTNRVVPIHSKIRPLVERRYKEALAINSKYLINAVGEKTRNSPSGSKVTYNKYAKRFIRIRDELKLNPEHRAHDGRVYFVTSAKRYGVDEYAIKYIVGHAINDVTESVYTKRDVSWLKDEIEKIK
jgi:integrase